MLQGQKGSYPHYVGSKQRRWQQQRSGNRCPSSSNTSRATSSNRISSDSGTSSSKFQPQSWRWYGFDTETTGLDVERDCVIQMAAYDLESGDSFTALVNPALHHPDYRFGSEAYKHHGIPKSLLDSQGLSLSEAFAGLVRFVRSTTPQGQTPALVAHTGFKFHFHIMQQNLQKSAAAAVSSAPDPPGARPAAAWEQPAETSREPAAASSSSNSTAAKRRRRRQQLTAPTAVQAVSSKSSNSTKQVPIADLCSSASLTAAEQQQQQVYAGWPADWMFHDTYVLAHCLLQMQPPESTVRARLGNLTRRGLAQALLPPPYTEDDVQPRERAYADAASVARMTPVLLSMLQSPPQPPSSQDQQQQQRPRHGRGAFTWEQSQQLYECHAHWLCRPWPLRYSSGCTAQDQPGGRQGWRGVLSGTGPLSMCPPGMLEAAVRAADKCGTMDNGSDPVVAAIGGYYSFYATNFG